MSAGPSIVPGAPEDYYIVLNSYGRHGVAFAETDFDRANYEATVAYLIASVHPDPLRVIRFNPQTGECEDVTAAVALEVRRRLDLKGDEVPPELEDFDRACETLNRVRHDRLRKQDEEQIALP